MPSAIVIGAGVFGACLAHRLAAEGWTVTLVEQYQPGHVRASSGGESRLLRASHGTDRWYLRSARRARELWREIEAETGQDLYLECGVAWFATEPDGWEADSAVSLEAEDVPALRLDPDGAARLYPGLRTEDLSFVLLEPEAGVLRAAAAVRAVAEAAARRGVRRIAGRARPDGAAVRVDGERLEADTVVWAAGPWLPGLFPDLIELRVSRQDVCFFGAGPAWAAGRVPAFVEYGGAAYGLGDLDGRGFKAAYDREGPGFDPETGDRRLDPASETAVRAYLQGRFPALAAAPLLGHRTCQYTVTADGHFVSAPHPEHPSVWLYGGGSGHGFKHGPALAEYAVPILAGDAAPDARFGLLREARASGLRTAGADPST